MASLAGHVATGFPVPQGVSLRTSPNLVPVNFEQEMQAEKFSRSEFIEPLINVTKSAVFGQGFEINLFRDSTPEDEDADGMFDMQALKKQSAAAKNKGKEGKPPTPGKKRPGGDGDEKDSSGPQWDEDKQAPWVAQRSAVGLQDSDAEDVEPTKRPPQPKYPEPDTSKAREKIPFSEDMRHYIGKEWNQAGRELFVAGERTGVVVVRFFKDGAHRCFAIVPTHLRRPYFQENTLGQVKRRWFVEFTDRKASTIMVTADGKVKDPSEAVKLETASAILVDPSGKDILMEDPTVTVQDNTHNRGFPTMDGGVTNLIFIFYQPDSFGNLTSPVYLSSKVVSALEATRYTETYTLFRRAQPLHVIATGPKQAGGSGAGTSGREQFTPSLYANGDMLQERRDYGYNQTLEEQQKYQLAAKLAVQRGGATVGGAEIQEQLEMAKLAANTGQPHYVPPNINAMANIYAGVDLMSPVRSNALVLPAGQTMMGGPTSEGSANFSSWVEHLNSSLCAIWEVPPQVLNPAGTKYASDGDTINKRWDAKVRDHCGRLAEFLAIIFSATYADRAAMFAKIIRKALKDGTDTVKRRKTDIAVDREAEMARLKVETPQAKALNDVLTSNITQKKQTELGQIRKSLRVEVSFNVSMPAGDPALVDKLLSMDGIDTNTAIAVLGEKAGIPRNLLLLTDEARVEARRQRLQADTDTLHANMPPPVPLNAEGKPVAKQAPPQKPPAKPSFEVKK